MTSVVKKLKRKLRQRSHPLHFQVVSAFSAGLGSFRMDWIQYS